MFALKKSKRTGSSRRQINIKGVRDDILLLPNNEYKVVLEISSVNFELKSDNEQDALIDTYESFLNSLPCPIQINVRIRELDLSDYLDNISRRAEKEELNIYKEKLHDYADFVSGLVAENKILSRQFYIVLSYSSKTKDSFDEAKERLALNSDLVSKGLSRLGIHTERVDGLKLLTLFQSFYNPTQAKYQPISKEVVNMLNSSIVERVS